MSLSWASQLWDAAVHKFPLQPVEAWLPLAIATTTYAVFGCLLLVLDWTQWPAFLVTMHPPDGWLFFWSEFLLHVPHHHILACSRFLLPVRAKDAAFRFARPFQTPAAREATRVQLCDRRAAHILRAGTVRTQRRRTSRFCAEASAFVVPKYAGMIKHTHTHD